MAASGLSIGTLSGSIELDTKTFSASIDISAEALDQIVKRFKEADTGAADAAKGFLIAEAAIKAVEKIAHLGADALREMTVEGARVADVEENFNRLTLGAGELGDELLGTLRDGTRATITDFELMKAVNDNLAAGVRLTQSEYNTLATGAFSLAQAKGIEVKEAFIQINDALLTGRVRSLQYLTGKIDLAKAEEDYAKKLDTTVDRLTAEEKIQAARQAILSKVGDAIERLGEQEDGLDEKIDQATVRWANFQEELGATIATSPVIIQAFEDIEQIFTDAFGGDKEEAIRRITGAVEDFAQVTVSVVDTGVGIVEFIIEYREVLEPLAVSIGAYTAAVYIAENATKVWAATTATTSTVIGTMAGPIGIITVAAGLMYAAFELGKWQPISDFFEEMALRVFYDMSEAEAEAAMQATRLAEESSKASKGMDEQARAAEEIALATQDWREVLQTVNPEIAKQAEELLRAGVSAKSVATEYNLTAGQVKALQSNVAETNKILERNAELLDEDNVQMRLSRKEAEDMAKAWDNLNSLGKTWQDTLAKIPENIRESVTHYAALGATVKDLTEAFPNLTEAQARAAVEGAKAAGEVAQRWLETFEITSKAHGDNLNDWVRLEEMKYQRTVELLRQQGKATEEMLDATRAKFEATVEAEIDKRAQQIETSRAFYQKEVEDAQAKLDLMLKSRENFTAQDIRLAEEALREKQRLLNNWAADANQKLEEQTSKTKAETGEQVKSLLELRDHWLNVGVAIDKNTEKVKTLSGEVLTLKEYEARQLMGGTSQINYQNFRDSISNYATSIDRTGRPTMGLQGKENAAVELAKKGYSFEQIVWILQNPGMPPPPSPGPRIPGFKEGGSGDFGDGTLVMLHGKETIIPDGMAQAQVNAGDNISMEFYINGTATDVARQVSSEIMKTLKRMKQFGAA